MKNEYIEFKPVPKLTKNQMVALRKLARATGTTPTEFAVKAVTEKMKRLQQKQEEATQTPITDLEFKLLTQQEQGILLRMCGGQGIGAISRECNLSEEMVRLRINQILKTLNIADRNILRLRMRARVNSLSKHAETKPKEEPILWDVTETRPPTIDLNAPFPIGDLFSGVIVK